ncbi:MAG: MFS transporter [Spirochaetes bacterium]|nr:MFS transporter [Spirochaetota bacterium]
MSKMDKQEISWILYDVANSAFVLVMVTAIMPIFFKDIASTGVEGHVSTWNWGRANSIASLLLAFIAPVLGAFADHKGSKKKFITSFILLGLLFTLLLLFIKPGQWQFCLILFVIARVGWAGANIFYDSFLIDVTSKDRMDWISASGFGWGYIGSCIPFIGVLALVQLIKEPGQIGAISLTAAKLSFIIVALWWFLFSLPLFFNVKQKHYIKRRGNLIIDSFRNLIQTALSIFTQRNLFFFLLAYFFYIDGVGTIITMATAYGRDIGLSTTFLILAILVIQIVAFPFALLYGKLAKLFSAKTMIYIGIIVYSIITFVAFIIPAIPSNEIKKVLFWVLSILVASSQGGIQALSRSLFGKLIPPEKSAEYFGFFNIFGKFAAILGPFIMGYVGLKTGDSKYGVLSIFILFIFGAILLSQVKEQKEV